MQNFSIGFQITKEIDEFKTKKVQLASFGSGQNIRFLSKKADGYYYNQHDTINIIDLYYNSVFENGQKDKLGQQKIFLNIGKFRTEVAAKQIDIDVKDFKFIPDDYADPWTAIFLQKDFKEWTKDSDFGELINCLGDNFPKYGSIVLKKVGRDVEHVPLQNLINEQTAECLDEASYVIETHPNMYLYEMKEMKNWNTDGLKMRYDETMDVYERYGHVPVSWLKKVNGQTVQDGDSEKSVDAMVICGKNPKVNKETKEGWHIFYAAEIKERPYREAHWNKQHGRWLGLGVMEDLIENQKAKNIIVNLQRRAISTSSKRLFQTTNIDSSVKNLVSDIEDGSVIEVGANGDIREITMNQKTNGDFTSFMQEFDRNSDQKAFTYEVATGEAMPSGTPFRLGVVLSEATNAYFNKKREKFGLFLKKVIIDFMIPRFLREMGNKNRTIAMFTGENGFETLREAAKNFVRTETARVSLLSGNPVDALSIEQAVQPFESVQALFFDLPASYYNEAKFKFDLSITGEEIDVQSKRESLSTLYQLMNQKGDPRSERVLQRIMQLSGESIAQFGTAQMAPTPNQIPNGSTPNTAPTPAPATGQLA